MRQSILGKPIEEVEKSIVRKRIFCIALFVLVLGLNILFCFLRTDKTHHLFLCMNIFLDTGYVWFLIFYLGMILNPMSHLVKLWKRPSVEQELVIENISTKTERIPNFSCYVVNAAGKNYYLPEDGNISLEIGAKVRVRLVDNIITEVTDEKEV